MEPTNEQSQFIKSLCQHCSGHIKYSISLLRKGETRQIECPHCHLETIIYRPVDVQAQATPLPPKAEERQPKSSNIELFLFASIRILALTGALIILFAFLVIGYMAVQTFLPEKPQGLSTIWYSTIALEPLSSDGGIGLRPNGKPAVPVGAKMAASDAFPQPVVSFLLTHQNFSLKEWLDKLPPAHRKPFLENLAKNLQEGSAKHLTFEQTEELARSFGDMWMLLNERPPDPNAEIKKGIFRASCVSAAFGLLIVLTIICLILVLLAIERNTRQRM